MQYLVIFGVVLTLIGLAGLVTCVLRAARIKRAGGTVDEMRDRLQGIVALNLGALGLSAVGLMCVVLGLVLG